MKIPINVRDKLRKWKRIIFLIMCFCLAWEIVYEGILKILNDLPGWLVNNIPFIYDPFNDHVSRELFATMGTFLVMVLIYHFYRKLIEKDKMIYEVEKIYKILSNLEKDIETFKKISKSDIDAKLYLDRLYDLYHALRFIIQEQSIKESSKVYYF